MITLRLRFAFVCVLLALLPTSPSWAQKAPTGPDLNVMALEWARGIFGSPLLCQVENQPVRAVRRVLIAPAPPNQRGAMDRIQFPESDAQGATRCFSELGAEEPLITGSVTILLPTRSRPDTARIEFESQLKREGGFRFDIQSGVLAIKGWRVGEELREVDFSGGHARLDLVKSGSDAARLLRDFESPRRLTLMLEAPDGESLTIHLFQVADR